MFFRKETNKIDELIKENERLKVERQKVEDKKNEANSKLETRISAHETIIKALRDKSFRNDEICKNTFAVIDREIERNEEQIKLEDRINHKRVSSLTVKVEKKCGKK